jgi:N-dimethylarginine dimethylaminohydrolase
MKVGAVEPERAVRQHRAFTRLLEGLGAKVDVVPFVHGAFDSIFVKDNAVLVHQAGRPRALLARPRHTERKVEQSARRKALVERGFEVQTSLRASFEGGDVVVVPSHGHALLGTGFRSERSAADELAAFLGMPVHVLELRDPRLYHLDMALLALSDGTTAFCPEAFEASSVRWIERHFPPETLMRVPYADASAFALNVIEVGRHVILGGPSALLRDTLTKLGFIVHVPDLTQFRYAGGSAACLVSRVHGETVSVALPDVPVAHSSAA